MGSLGALGFIMLFHYQNCAPANRMQALNSNGLVSNDSGIVTTIDDVNATTGVSFTQSKLQLPESQQPTVIQGACDAGQNGAVLGWKVRNAIGVETERGYSVCEQGKFEVEMAPASDLECDQPYDLTARLNTGVEGQVELQRLCGAVNAAKTAENSSN